MTIIPVMLLLIQQLKIIVCFRLSRMIVTPFHNIQCRRNNHPQSLSLPKVQTSIQHAIRDLVKSDSDKVPHYCICPQCARAYILNSKEPLKNPGEQVRCDACNKEWFLHASKVQIANNLKDFIDHTETPQHISKRDIYVANVPYEYSNDDLGALFQEYGVSNAFVVLDKDKNSKGFGFLEVRFYNFNQHLSSQFDEAI